MKILSIIVPSYNMEAYLPKCLGSLIVEDKELLQGLDVVVVNDGSKDRTSEIAHEFETKYPGVFRVIDKANGNYGSCINVGLKMAQGEYVKILDADDSFAVDNLGEYIKFLEGAEEELVLNDYDEVDALGNVRLHFSYDLPTGATTSIEDLLIKHRYVPMHTIAYKSTLFHKFTYHQAEGVSYTDTQWSILPLAMVQQVAYFGKTIYRYLVERSGRTMEDATQVRNAWMYARIGLESAEQYVKIREELHGNIRLLMDYRVASLCSVLYRLATIEYRNRVKGVDLYGYDQRLKNVSRPFYDIVGGASKCYYRLISIN